MHEVLAKEASKLKNIWDSYPLPILARHLPRTALQRQTYFTRRKLLEYFDYKYPARDVLLEENLIRGIVYWYLSKAEQINARFSFVRGLYFSLLFACGRMRSKRLAGLPPVSIADLGCSVGNYYDVFLQSGLGPFLTYTGVDIAENNINICKKKFAHAENARFEVGNIYDLRYPDASFDIVMVNHVFEHLSDAAREQAIAEVVRVTKDIAVLNFFNLENIPEHRITPKDNYHWNQLSRQRFIDSLVRHGIRREDIVITDTYPPIRGGKRFTAVSKDGLPNIRASLVFKKEGCGLKLSTGLF